MSKRILPSKGNPNVVMATCEYCNKEMPKAATCDSRNEAERCGNFNPTVHASEFADIVSAIIRQ